MWLRTVPSLMKSRRATPALSRPSATASTTSYSRSVRGANTAPRGAGPRPGAPVRPRPMAALRESTSPSSTHTPAMTLRSAGARRATSCLTR